YQGFEIAHSDLRVYFTPDGDLRDIDGEFHYDINLSTNYSIDSATAVGIALRDIGTLPETEVPLIRCPGKPIIVPSSELNLRDESKLYLVWPISMFTVTAQSYYADSVDYAGIKRLLLAPTGKEYVRYIDAHNGNIVKSGDTSPKDWPKGPR
ncbi:MAG: hypothetical protein L0Y74_04560, partial [candidate division Zixibacteria bacterium]|nr:hypothetical protein [candidate division Zixibacteria bacterium]